MLMIQLALIVFLFIVVRWLTYKVRKYETYYTALATKYNELIDKHNMLLALINNKDDA
jgi:hypothetical protein